MNLLHILLDNNIHDSTGGQATVSHIVDFVGIAASSSYPISIKVNNLEEFSTAIKEWMSSGQFTFIHSNISKGSPADLGRPTVKPRMIKERLMKFIGG
jgi:phosphonopyruvate decarboxylase